MRRRRLNKSESLASLLSHCSLSMLGTVLSKKTRRTLYRVLIAEFHRNGCTMKDLDEASGFDPSYELAFKEYQQDQQAKVTA